MINIGLLFVLISIIESVAITGAFAGEPSGAVRLCRESDLVEQAQTKFDKAYIRLPTGLLLEDYGPEQDSDALDHRWPMAIITVKPTEIPPHIKCVVVAAILSPLSRVRSVSPRDHRYLEITGLATPDGRTDLDTELPSSWDWVGQIYATVASEFR